MESNQTVTIKGNPLTLIGPQIRTGQVAPDFKVLTGELKERSLADFKGKVKLIASVPSLDTPVCDLEIKRFNEEAVKLSKDVAVLCISVDLPFAQNRFCQASSIKQVTTLSDHRDTSFGIAYGVLIKELRLLARAVFVVDRNDKVRYVEIVKEVTTPPDYTAALKALGEACK